MRECCIHDTGTVLKISFILDRNLAKANCTEDHVCTSCDKVVLVSDIYLYVNRLLIYYWKLIIRNISVFKNCHHRLCQQEYSDVFSNWLTAINGKLICLFFEICSLNWLMRSFFFFFFFDFYTVHCLATTEHHPQHHFPLFMLYLPCHSTWITGYFCMLFCPPPPPKKKKKKKKKLLHSSCS